MIELVIKNYLETKFTDIPIVFEVNDHLNGAFILVEKTGSKDDIEHMGEATIAIQCYELSMFEAAQLNEQIKDAMYDIIALSSISKCSLNSDYNYTDTTTKHYRYQSIWDVVYF